MSRARAALVRHARHRVEEIRRALARLDAERVAIRDQIGALDADVAREAKVDDLPIDLTVAAAYRARRRAERKALVERLAALDHESEGLARSLVEARIEARRFELLAERAERRRAQAEARRSQRDLDELALIARAKAT